MFSGIVTAVGRVGGGKDAEAAGAAGRYFFICPPGWLAGVPLGGSIAVNGVCLTVVAFGEGDGDGGDSDGDGAGTGVKSGNAAGLAADLSAETCHRCVPFLRGDFVNLEQPLVAGAAIGGHFVGGHVDGVGKIKSVYKSDDGGMELFICPPPHLLPLIAEKGAVAVDGVSLTVAALRGEAFSVCLVPHTVQNTIFGEAKAGGAVNIEADMLARHLARLWECGYK